MKIETFVLPALIISAGLSFIPSGNKSVTGSGHWTSSGYVYQTREPATFRGERDGVATFETSDGNVWECFVDNPVFQDGETIVLTFENCISREEYALALERGIDYGTRENARIFPFG